jgi:hypothetical protein
MQAEIKTREMSSLPPRQSPHNYSCLGMFCGVVNLLYYEAYDARLQKHEIKKCPLIYIYEVKNYIRNNN